MEKTKNCWVIPTDKPSRLFRLAGDLHLHEECGVDSKRNQNIYITSDEEIKEGDWVVFNELEIVKCTYSKNGEYLFSEPLTSSSNHHFSYFKKIILTTDQDLIKDGVQAIDDDFLEWFVKNPSCEEVKVKDVYKTFLEGDKKSVSNFRNRYKIIIPKEESKQCDICNMYPRLEGTNKCESCYSVIRHFLEQDLEFKDKLLPDLRKKQETLEEITEQIQKDCHKFVESIISKVTYQDATNTFLFMKLAELTLKLKKYE